MDTKDSKQIGKLTVPFILAIFLALLLEDLWDELALEHQLMTVILLVVVLLLVYQKKVWKLLT